ncbi:MAG: beta-propeller fold lactonase family protein, partial [Bacteroidota bacterium]|nr:beta-propeller fold lactonase family protein [Bacteroidota bacterium]
FWNESTLMASPDNEFVYLTDFMGVMVFKRDVKTGKIAHIQSIEGDSDYKMFHSISSIKISMDGTKVYILSKYNNSIVLFSRDKTTGKLLYSGTIKNGQNKIRGIVDATDILMSKNDKHLYTLAEYGTNNIGFYNRTSDGKLEFEKNITWQELGPEIGAVKDFQLSPDEKCMYISSTNMYGIRILNRDVVSGDLTFYKSYTDADTGLSGEKISEFVIPDDGKNLYAATDNSMVHYEIDQTTHDLKFITKLITDGKTGSGIPGQKKIITSNDGKNIYTFSRSMFFVNGISVFARTENGHLQHVENLDSYQFKFMIDQPFSLAMSPDDKYLYVAGTSLFCFKRNPDNGKLTLNFEIKYDDLDVKIYRLNDITISNDGKYLLAVSNEQKIALSFYRSNENGKLLLKQRTKFSGNRNYATMVPFSIFSGDMKNAYIVSPYDGTLGVYEAAIPLGLPPVIDVCKDDIAEISVDEGYNYRWSNGETQHLIKTTIPGQYTVQVTDNTGRKGADTTKVIFHNPPLFSLEVDNTLSNSGFTFINSTITEGSWPFSYLWNDGSAFQFIRANNADSINKRRDYILTITDKYGCSSSDTLTLMFKSTNSEDRYEINNHLLSIFPNPFNQYIYIGFQNTRYANLSVKVIDMDGKELLRSNLKSEQSNRLDLSFLKPGIYILEVTENNLTEKRKIIKL